MPAYFNSLIQRGHTVATNMLRVDPILAAFAKLERIRGYRDGWAYGEGLAFPELVYMLANRLLAMAQLVPGGSNADVFPGRHGQITVAFYKDNETYDFIVDKDNVRVVREFADGEECDISFAQAVSALFGFGVAAPRPATVGPVISGFDVQSAQLPLGIGCTPWNSYESFIQTNMSLQSDALRGQHLNHTWTWTTSPSSKKIVPWVPPLRSVGT
jgi:hypothetical protein